MNLVGFCCGFGHREFFSNIEKDLYNTIIRLIEERDVSVFYTGGDGDFDMLFSAAVRRAKKLYPHIKLYLVKPYMLSSLNKDKDFYEAYYDDVIIPQELLGCHPKGAIAKRNRWIADKCDWVIAFVPRGFGGAYTAVKYAEKKNKQIIYMKNDPEN